LFCANVFNGVVKKRELARKKALTEAIIHDINASSRSPVTPVYIRLPPPGGRCAYTGLSRSALSEICIPCRRNRNKPPVVSIALPKKHKLAKRQARLINFERLMRFLREQERKVA
jgi:hypothetical protein